jgi:hypothetical protein
MINLVDDILNALRTDAALLNLLGGPFVWHLVAGNDRQLPRITFFEVDNVDAQYADGQATANYLYYQIDIWDRVPRPDILAEVDRIMKSIGFTLMSTGPDLYENDTGIVHKAPRYSIAKSLK